MDNCTVFEVELIDTHLLDVDLVCVDIINSVNLSSISDVNISNVQDGQLLVYNATTEKWENTTIDLIVQDVSVFDEAPARITTKKFRTSNNYQSGTLRVYFNGLREKNITEVNSKDFEIPIDSEILDDVRVDYIKDV